MGCRAVLGMENPLRVGRPANRGCRAVLGMGLDGRLSIDRRWSVLSGLHLMTFCHGLPRPTHPMENRTLVPPCGTPNSETTPGDCGAASRLEDWKGEDAEQCSAWDWADVCQLTDVAVAPRGLTFACAPTTTQTFSLGAEPAGALEHLSRRHGLVFFTQSERRMPC
jgi:hypothetical protein